MKKGYSVIDFYGNGKIDWLIYKHPITEVWNNSKLIVNPGQVAIVVRNGQIDAIFKEGTTKINSNTVPFLSSIEKSFHKGKTPWPVQFYFINTRLKLDAKWGTSSPIEIKDPIYGIIIRIRGRGQLGFKVENYQFLYEKLVGSIRENGFLEFDFVLNIFRGKIQQYIKSILLKKMNEDKISYDLLNLHLDEFQSELENKLRFEMTKFGFDLINLSLDSLNIPIEDREKINSYLSKKAELDILQNNYRLVKGYDVTEKLAENNNGSANMILGMGLGQSLNGSNPIIPPDEPKKESQTMLCYKCSSPMLSTSKFCSECGTANTAKCPNCQNKIAYNPKFCSECGFKLKD
ncbi:SPFH domain-containing protein [Mycoplasmopsis gallinarum]|uniref:SPFH domain-containing protein n=1 Tax=Mycoplasmopsis gallinarum TaxID=29557 RepID=UPI0004862B51|nr:SPFH domain-containing protein [Mycoplasmopsis gallinarum]